MLLREDFARADKPLRVDRDKGIIHGVKVVGLQSPNTHGVDGAEGTVYSRKALEEAARLYEGAPVNIDHPDRSKPKSDRSSNDRFGRLQGVELRPDGLYADLHYLKSHPMAERVTEAAERMPDLFALSHNAYGRGEVREGRYVVSEIPEVRSVDLVADGGTNKSLFESKERRPMKRNLRKLAESARKCKTRRAFAKLLEMYEDEYEDAGDEEAEEAGLDDHLGNVILSIMKAVKDGDMSPDEGRKKVLAAYKMSLKEDDGEEEEHKTEEAEEEDDEGKGRKVEEDDGERAEDHDSESGTGDKEPEEGGLKKPTKAQESSRRRAPRGAVRLTEARAEALCELAGVEPAEELLESLQDLTEEKALKHLKYIKGLSRGQRPRTQLREGRGDDGGDFQDVTKIKDGKSFAQMLRRGFN